MTAALVFVLVCLLLVDGIAREQFVQACVMFVLFWLMLLGM